LPNLNIGSIGKKCIYILVQDLSIVTVAFAKYEEEPKDRFENKKESIVTVN
jgi:hypothetical protein